MPIEIAPAIVPLNASVRNALAVTRWRPGPGCEPPPPAGTMRQTGEHPWVQGQELEARRVLFQAWQRGEFSQLSAVEEDGEAGPADPDEFEVLAEEVITKAANPDLIAALRPLIQRVRTDVTAIKKPGGGIEWTRQPLTTERLAKHLNGGPARGVCPIKAGESVTMVALLDLDSHKGETSWEAMAEAAERIAAELLMRGLVPNPWRSSGGRGIHLIMLWDEPQDAYSVRQELIEALAECGFKNGTAGVRRGQAEVFPKQDCVALDGFGNQFILPLAGKSEPLDAATMRPLGRSAALGKSWAMSRPVEVHERPAPPITVPTTVEIGLLDRALWAIPNDAQQGPDRDGWFKLLCAYKEGGGDREVARAWTQQHPSWKSDREFDVPWNSIKVGKPGGVPVDHLIRVAESHGFDELTALEFTAVESEEKPASASAGKVAWQLPAAISTSEWDSARLTPDCIVANYLYADVAILIAPGGTGKTTLLLFEAVHIVLGLPLWGREVLKPGPVLVLTAEDSREMLVARLNQMCAELMLDDDQVARVRAGVLISDLGGSGTKLVTVRDEVVVPAPFVDELILGAMAHPPALVTIDPAVSFGVGESRVNDAEQGLIEAARKIRNALRCCVRYVHHTGKVPALNKSFDQYAGRNGSAFADGARMVAVMHTYRPGTDGADSKAWASMTGRQLHPGQSGIALALAKLSYAAPQDMIFIERNGMATFNMVEASRPVKVTAAERNEGAMRMILERVRTDLGLKRRHTKATLEAIASELDLNRAQVRDAVTLLIAQGDLADVELTPPPARGARRFLEPRETRSTTTDDGRAQ